MLPAGLGLQPCGSAARLVAARMRLRQPAWPCRGANHSPPPAGRPHPGAVMGRLSPAARRRVSERGFGDSNDGRSSKRWAAGEAIGVRPRPTATREDRRSTPWRSSCRRARRTFVTLRRPRRFLVRERRPAHKGGDPRPDPRSARAAGRGILLGHRHGRRLDRHRMVPASPPQSLHRFGGAPRAGRAGARQCARLGATRLEVVNGRAPEAFWGSRSRRRSSSAAAYRSRGCSNELGALPTGGRLVVNAVTLETETLSAPFMHGMAARCGASRSFGSRVSGRCMAGGLRCRSRNGW